MARPIVKITAVSFFTVSIAAFVAYRSGYFEKAQNTAPVVNIPAEHTAATMPAETAKISAEHVSPVPPPPPPSSPLIRFSPPQVDEDPPPIEEEWSSEADSNKKAEIYAPVASPFSEQMSSSKSMRILEPEDVKLLETIRMPSTKSGYVIPPNVFRQTKDSSKKNGKP